MDDRPKLLKMYLFEFDWSTWYGDLSVFKYFETKEKAKKYKDAYFKLHYITKRHIAGGFAKFTIKETLVVKIKNKYFSLENIPKGWVIL